MKTITIEARKLKLMIELNKKGMNESKDNIALEYYHKGRLEAFEDVLNNWRIVN